MKQVELKNLLDNLFEKSIIYAPVKNNGRLLVSAVDNLQKIDWSGVVPENTFKNLFLPVRENLVEFDNQGKAKEIIQGSQLITAWGMNIMDLEAFSLFEQVFAKDSYYLRRRRNLLVVGYSNGIENDFRKYKIWHEKFEEDILEHRSFDIFIERQKNGKFNVFSGSENGQNILEDNNILDYEHIEFVGYVPEKGQPLRLRDFYQRVKDSFSKEIWDELNAKCIACGRCTMACPTCFCFDTIDIPQKDKIVRQRQWSSCFYNDFSEMAGGHEPLDTIKKKIYFWYYHKFVRIPEEFNFPGCVSCMRCVKACPVDINIVQVLNKLKKEVNSETQHTIHNT